jgi:hypothetical protein
MDLESFGDLKLYHFTCLCYLPAILREGIYRGEVPITQSKILQAPNLTTNANPAAHRWVADCLADKLSVRLTVKIQPGDTRLVSYRNVFNRHRRDKKFFRRLDRYGQSKFWLIFWGVIPPESIEEVRVRDVSSEYRVYSGDALQQLVSAIEEERRKLRFEKEGVGLREGYEDCLLFDGPGRAEFIRERFLEGVLPVTPPWILDVPASVTK